MSILDPISVAPIREGRGLLCRRILDDLPDWFGIATAVDAYSRAADDLPMFAAFDGSEIVGFVSIKAQTTCAAESLSGIIL